MPLVQQPPLPGIRLRRQRGPEEPSLGRQQLPHPAQKRRVGPRQLSRQILEVHIQPGKVLPQHRLQYLRRQPPLGFVVRQDNLRPAGIELPRLRQRGQVHHRLCPPGPGRLQHGLVVQRQQTALCRNAVGKGGHRRKIGKLLCQQFRRDKGIGVAVEHALPDLLPEIRDYQQFSRRQSLPAAQGPVVPPQLPDGGPVARSDGGQGFPRRYDMDLPGKAHHQRLSHRQGVVRRQFVVRRQLAGGHAIPGGDGVHRLAGTHHMNCHGHHLFQKDPMSAPLSPMRIFGISGGPPPYGCCIRDKEGGCG